MGYLGQADELVRNATDALDKILQSPMATKITGLGEPVKVTWLNINDKHTTEDEGLGTTDSLIGKNSSFRFNRVEGLPVYNIIQQMQQLEIAMDENGILDTSLEIEPILLPNTIIPTPNDYMIYHLGSGRDIVFRANDFKLVSTNVNSYYRVPMHIVDIDSDEYIDKLDDQVVNDMKVIVDNIGTNESCIVVNKVYDKIMAIKKVATQAFSDYVDTFFVTRYSSFILRGYNNNFIVYDPYLTKFILNNNLVDCYDELIQPAIIEQGDEFRGEYNKTVFRAVELRNPKKIKRLVGDLKEFTRQRTNPFSYWGEETVYSMSVYEDKDVRYPKNLYMDFDWLYNIGIVKESPTISKLENLIMRYFQNETFEEFMTIEELKQLETDMEPEYNEMYFYLMPIMIYILMVYKDYLNNAHV